MRHQRRRLRSQIAAVVMAMALAVVVPSHVAAQSGSAGSTQGTDDLRRRIEELERAMKAQIEALRLQLARDRRRRR